MRTNSVGFEQQTHLLKYNFVETPRKFTIAELPIRKLGSSSVLIIKKKIKKIRADENPSLRIESFAIVNLRGVSTKLYFNLIFTMQTYKNTLVNCFLRKIFLMMGDDDGG